jgi:hypothetical protein
VRDLCVHLKGSSLEPEEPFRLQNWKILTKRLCSPEEGYEVCIIMLKTRLNNQINGVIGYGMRH